MSTIEEKDTWFEEKAKDLSNHLISAITLQTGGKPLHLYEEGIVRLLKTRLTEAYEYGWSQGAGAAVLKE